MINASNRTTENILINNAMKNKRPTFNEAFNKINKHTMNKTANDPLNIIHSNEQLYKYYVKETMPLLDVSNETFGDKKSNMFNTNTNTNNNDDNTNNTMKKMMRLMGLIDDEDGMDRNDFKTMEGSVNTLPLQSSDGLNLPSSAVDIPDIPQGRIQLVLTNDETDQIILNYDEGAIVLLNEIFERLMMPDIVNDDVYNDFMEKVQNNSFSYILENYLNYDQAINEYLDDIFTPDKLKDSMINKEVINAIYGDGTYEYIDSLYETEKDIINNNTVKQILDNYMGLIPTSTELIPTEEVPEMSKKEKKTGRRRRNRKNKDDDVEDDDDDEKPVQNIDIEGGRPIQKRRRGAPIKTDLTPEQLEKNRDIRMNKQIDQYVLALRTNDRIIRTKTEKEKYDFQILANIARIKSGDNINEFNRILLEDMKAYEDTLSFNTFG